MVDPMQGGNTRFASEPNMVRPTMSTTAHYQRQSIRQKITFDAKKFDVTTLPIDMQRVVAKLTKDFGEDYALTFAFMVRTASELHRAWHMTLLTSKILQQIKDKFQIRTTWELGVTKLKFRAEDGSHELHRKVPYDYDSEFQDLYAKIAVALVDGQINIHQALTFQSNTKRGKHTAASGLFLRDFPGRLVLYPLEAATCAVIFFGGDWADAGVAAVTGLCAGLMEWFLVSLNSNAKILIDVLVGITTGIVGGLFYRYLDEPTCLPAVFLGVLYWFFYGTAFVIGILEIVAGELETGVIRFMAVAVKTFVLSLGSTWGLQIASRSPIDDFQDTAGCNNIDLDTVWWRIPLYLLCSASALGQYRFPIVYYWRGLVIQLVGYEVQYQMFKLLAQRHDRDLLDTATANAAGAIAAVIAACLLSWIVDSLSYYYNARTLMRVGDDEYSKFGECVYSISVVWLRFMTCLGLGRKDEQEFLDMQPRLRQMSSELDDPNNPRTEIRLSEEEERLLKQAVVASKPLNVWSLLMPTVYQLVPGSLIARLWYNSIFPPPYVQEELQVVGTDGSDTGFSYISWTPDQAQESVFSALMVIATSLALGLLLGMGLQSVITAFYRRTVLYWIDSMSSMSKSTRNFRAKMRVKNDERQGLMNTPEDDDPDSGELLPTPLPVTNEPVAEVEKPLSNVMEMDDADNDKASIASA
ncbi:unnamed protein product [Cylindrotheca closterium]|uniref:Threonine/serine exporter-like N-terminal domain-containing protein n=1 Tax=Cylindrotheca closterium TaxID=2856 RepID=A0AAD2CVZ2_9STRA|nr:unnamed protein product [Cylindrotheca closterium]